MRGVQVKLWDPLRTRAITEVYSRPGAVQIHVYLTLPALNMPMIPDHAARVSPNSATSSTWPLFLSCVVLVLSVLLLVPLSSSTPRCETNCRWRQRRKLVLRNRRPHPRIHVRDLPPPDAEFLCYVTLIKINDRASFGRGAPADNLTALTAGIGDSYRQSCSE